jgi:hypothetical protein
LWFLPSRVGSASFRCDGGRLVESNEASKDATNDSRKPE